PAPPLLPAASLRFRYIAKRSCFRDPLDFSENDSIPTLSSRPLMYLHALATAVPTATFTQSECWQIAERSTVRQRLKKRSMLILHTILRGDHGIATRHFAVPNVEQVFDLTPDQLNAAFRSEGPKLAGRALTAALAKAGL